MAGGATLLRRHLETWKAKALVAKAEREQWVRAKGLAEPEEPEPDPVAQAMEHAVWEAQRAAGQMANALERALERTQKLVDDVWTECDRVLRDAEVIEHQLNRREQDARTAETQAWMNREKIAASRELGVRITEWVVDREGGRQQMIQAVQVWTAEGWRDVPVIRVPAREDVVRTPWKDVREPEDGV
jgi:hypothetical protein